MDVREKLVELVGKARRYAADKCHSFMSCAECSHYGEHDGNCRNTYIADCLISHGVTVQEEAKLYWKPVKPGEWNLTCSACDSHLGCREDASFCPECGAKFVYPKAVAPQPPKGE